MNLFVDTSVWSLAFRRDRRANSPEVGALKEALGAERLVVSTGSVLQELLQGFSGPKARTQILERFRVLPLPTPNWQDHVDAAELRNCCRRSGVQVGTIHALFAQLCIHHKLTLLTIDKDCVAIVNHGALVLWGA